MVKGAIRAIPEQFLGGKAGLETHLGDSSIDLVLYQDVNFIGFWFAV